MPSRYWEPLAPPASPSAEDDEFADVSHGVPGGWTESDFGNRATFAEERAGLIVTMPANAVNDLAGIYKSILAGDGTWWTRLAILAPRGSTSRIGIALWQNGADSTGDIAWFHLRTNSADQAIVYSTHTAYNAAPSIQLTHALSTDASVSHIWLRVRRTGTTYAFDYSTDGVGWMLFRTGTLAITPLHIGVAMHGNGLGVTSVAVAPFWRYVASDVGLTGLMSGDMLILDPRGSGAVALGGLVAAVAAHVPEVASGAVFLEELYGGGTDFDVLGAGAAELSELTAAGSIFHVLEGAGAVSLEELTAAGAALHHISSVYGEAFLPQLVAAGTAGREVIASGDVMLGELYALGTDGNVGAATLGLLEAAGTAAVSTPPITGDTEPPASGSGGAGGNAGGGADICLDIDLSIEDAVTGVVTLIPQPVVLRLKARRRVISRTPSGYARATTLPGREAVIQWGEAFLPVEDMALLRALFAGRVNIVLWREPDGTLIRMRTRRDSFKTRWSWAQPGFYEPLILTLTEMP